MRASRFLVSAAACLLLLGVVDARSNGMFGVCDLTPVTTQGLTWPYGCYGFQYATPGDQNTWKSCFVMKWTAAPREATFYTLRTADGPRVEDDPVTYTPGVRQPLYLRTHDLGRKFIGLMMYAVPTGSARFNGTTGKEQHVGTWTYAKGDPWVLPPCGGETHGVLAHRNADIKPLLASFWFTGPPAGTGEIEFRVLIKQGEQNQGNFWWPARVLKLREGAPAPRPPASVTLPAANRTISLTGVPESEAWAQTVVGAPGQCCADACASVTPETPFCHAQRTLDIRSPASLLATVAQAKAMPQNAAAAGAATASAALVAEPAPMCRLPVLAGCRYCGGASMSVDTAFCSYRQTLGLDQCPRSFFEAKAAGTLKVTEPDACFTETLESKRPICVCSNDRLVQPRNPYRGGAPEEEPTQEMAVDPQARANHAAHAMDGEEVDASSSARVTPSLLLAASACVAALVSSASHSRSGSLSLVTIAIVLSLVALTAPTAQAHNYVKSLHRAREASVSTPCQERVSIQPHVQVVRGQNFEIEWSNGHFDTGSNDPFYFVTLREEHLYNVTDELFLEIVQEYLDLAPDNQKVIPPTMQKLHMRHDQETTVDSFWEDPAGLPQTDPRYIPRDPVLAALAHPSQYYDHGAKQSKPLILTAFKPEYLTKDQRAAYYNPKYPWIEAASKFHSPLVPSSMFADQSSIARFNVPARQGPGNYIVYFFWGGYKDCTDVNVVPGDTPVVNRYGDPSATIGVPGGKRYTKVEHAEVRYVGNPATHCRKVGPDLDVSACMRDCDVSESYFPCPAIQVTRYKNLNITLPWTPNIPFLKSHYDPANPCWGMTPHARFLNGCGTSPVNDRTYPLRNQDGGGTCNPADFADLKDDDYICFGVQPQRNQDAQVEEDIVTATEAADPVWYSTVWVAETWLNFDGIVQPPPKLPGTLAGEQCVACDFHAQLPRFNGSQAAKWALGLGECGECSVREMQGAPEVLATQLTGDRLTSAGYPIPGETDDPSSGDSKSFPILLVAIIAGGVLVMAAIGTLAVWWCRRKRSAGAMSNIAKIATEMRSTEMTGI